jgi:hypothetical protein
VGSTIGNTRGRPAAGCQPGQQPDEPLHVNVGDHHERERASEADQRRPNALIGTHGETLTITDDFEPYGVLDGELLVRVNGPRGGCKYRFTISRQELASLLPEWAVASAAPASRPAERGACAPPPSAADQLGIAEELAEWARGLGVGELDLDELIHDALGEQASSINNEGLKSQIAFLVDTYGPAHARYLIAGLWLDTQREPTPTTALQGG